MLSRAGVPPLGACLAGQSWYHQNTDHFVCVWLCPLLMFLPSALYQAFFFFFFLHVLDLTAVPVAIIKRSLRDVRILPWLTFELLVFSHHKSST